MKKRILKVTKIIFSTILGIIIVFCSVYLFRNYPRSASPFEVQVENPNQKILIATQRSHFKDQFVSMLVDSLSLTTNYIRGVEVNDLKDMNDDDWDKIIIINSFIVKLNRKADRFIQRAERPEKILLFVTSGGADWKPQPELQIDAITSASRIENENELIQLALDWISCDQNKTWEPEDRVLALLFFPRVDVDKACNYIKFEQDRYTAKYPDLKNIINLIGNYYLRLDDESGAQKIFDLNSAMFPEA